MEFHQIYGVILLQMKNAKTIGSFVGNIAEWGKAKA